MTPGRSLTPGKFVSKRWTSEENKMFWCVPYYNMKKQSSQISIESSHGNNFNVFSVSNEIISWRGF